MIAIDAAQKVTAYASDGAMPIAQAAGARRILDGSIVLDNTLGPERIVLVICDTPRSIEDIARDARQALARAGGNPRAMSAISSCREIVHTIEKIQ